MHSRLKGNDGLCDFKTQNGTEVAYIRRALHPVAAFRDVARFFFLLIIFGDFFHFLISRIYRVVLTAKYELFSFDTPGGHRPRAILNIWELKRVTAARISAFFLTFFPLASEIFHFSWWPRFYELLRIYSADAPFRRSRA